MFFFLHRLPIVLFVTLSLSLPLYSFILLPAPYRESDTLTLAQAEQMALHHNKNLTAQKHISAQGEYRRREQVARWLPGVAYSGRINRSPKAGGGNGTNLSGILRFSQLVFSPEAFHQLKIKEIENEQLQNDYQFAVNDLLYELRSAYYQVILSNHQVQVELDNIAILQEAYEQKQKRFAVESTTLFDVQQSKVNVVHAWSGYYEAVKQSRLARNQLLLFLGLDPNQEIHLDGNKIPLDQIPLIDSKVQQLKESSLYTLGPLFNNKEVGKWISLALKHRPLINKQRIEVEQAKREQSARRGEYLPKVSSYANQSNLSISGSSFLGESSYWDIGLTVEWTLFNGFARKNRVQEVREKQLAKDMQYEKSIQDTKGDIWNRFHEIEAAVLSYTAAEQEVTLAKEALDLAKKRVENGWMTPLEYRDIVQSLTQARQGFHQASFDLLCAYYALRRDSGIDLQKRTT